MRAHRDSGNGPRVPGRRLLCKSRSYRAHTVEIPAQQFRHNWSFLSMLISDDGRMRADIVPGGTFPDYELTDHTKIRHKLSELQGVDPMILVLSRGGFCPKDPQ